MDYRVFLSHSNEDADHVNRVKGQVAPLGVDLYAAEHDVQAGHNLEGKVLAAIRESDALVVLLTVDGAESAYVQQEVGAAKAAGTLVIPLVAVGVDRTRLGMLQGIEYIEFDPRQPEEAMDKLTLRLGKLLREKQNLDTQTLRSQRDLALVLAAVLGLILLAIFTSE